jgi:hypothetical protein
MATIAGYPSSMARSQARQQIDFHVRTTVGSLPFGLFFIAAFVIVFIG